MNICIKVDVEEHARVELLVKQMKAGAGIMEELKATEPMEWIGFHVEKSIEDTLLNGIVMRHRKSVQTQGRIMWLSEITQNDCKIIDDMMTKYSYYDHSMSDDAPLQEFTLEEIEQDVECLINWLTGVNKRRNKNRL